MIRQLINLNYKLSNNHRENFKPLYQMEKSKEYLAIRNITLYHYISEYNFLKMLKL